MKITEKMQMLEAHMQASLNLPTIAASPLTVDQIRKLAADLLVLPGLAGMPSEEVEHVVRRIISLHDVTIARPAVVVDTGHQPWLAAKKMHIEPYYWNRYSKLLGNKGISRTVITELNSISDQILDLLHDPVDASVWDRRGLVMGNVQSGKTQNYIGLIAKAADAGYKVVIVIAGIHNNLRNQTQDRIDEGFVGQHWKGVSRIKTGVGKIDDSRKPSQFTSSTRDFNKGLAQSVGIPLQNLVEPAVFVIKKNNSTLKHLIDWLKENNTKAGEKIREPMLLIDDEADNASINIKSSTSGASTINSHIRELLSLFDRSVYIGYTATPFANIFIDPDTDDEMLGEDLFPRSFIVNLESPSNYLGADRIFGPESSAFLRPIEDADAFLPPKHPKNFEIQTLPPSLEEALRTFLLARAVRVVRGQGSQHSSMLVNASRFIDVQGQLKREISARLEEIQESVRVNGRKSHAGMMADPEINALSEVFGNVYQEIDETWDQVSQVLWEAIAPISVVAVNSKSNGSLQYKDYEESGLHVIAVGGFSLSRGLTLEGLTTSYYLRNSMMYDTLLQMGRWFGYRPGYEDLCRIWMPDESAQWYTHITESVEELRSELRSMQEINSTPIEFGLKVRSHPDTLLITAKNKAGRGKEITVKTTLSKKLVETYELTKSSQSINLLGAKDFLNRLETATQGQCEVNQDHFLYREIPVAEVLSFISAFKNDAIPITSASSSRLIIDYIRENGDLLDKWDVAIPQIKSNPVSGVLVHGSEVRPQKRKFKEKASNRFALSDKHRVASRGIEKIGLSAKQIETAQSSYRAELSRAGETYDPAKLNYPDRIYRIANRRPLLMLHFIVSKEEAPTSEIYAAWGLSFPDLGTHDKTIKYVVNTTYLRDLIAQGESDDDDLEGLDDE
jgi:hypothetical protein